MKKLNILTILLICLMLSSCNDWLTVEPKAVTSKDKMFTTELGFSSALIGLYLELQNVYSPTYFMMGGNSEYLAGNYLYLTSAENDSYLYSSHRYTSTTIDSNLGIVFMEYYKIIANANILINALQGQNVVDKDEAAIIEGEALAVRAYCHFELLRLWGPVPTNVDATKKYLPYVTTVNSAPYEYATYEAYVQKVKDDFTKAVTLLEPVDPIVTYPNSQLNTSNTTISKYTSLFWYNRQKRFNVYGVKSLLARLYLWTGDKDNAYKAAKEIVELKNANGASKFTLGTQTNITSQDYLLFSEHLVGLGMTEWVDKAGAFSGRYSALVNSTSNIISKLYENQTDMRLNMFTSSFTYAFGQTVYGTLKYAKFLSTDYSSPKSIPLVRLSEMYLILMETAPLSEANQYYKTFRASRSASYTPLSEVTRLQEVQKEYVREYFSEAGQAFFTYKRMNASSLLLSTESMSPDNYVLPIPTGETGNYN